MVQINKEQCSKNAMRRKSPIPNTLRIQKLRLRAKLQTEYTEIQRSEKNARLSKFLKPNTLRSKDLKKCNEEQTNLWRQLFRNPWFFKWMSRGTFCLSLKSFLSWNIFRHISFRKGFRYKYTLIEKKYNDFRKSFFPQWWLMELKGTVKENERGYRLKVKHFRSWSRPTRVLSNVPVSRNRYKTVSNLFKNLYL